MSTSGSAVSAPRWRGLGRPASGAAVAEQLGQYEREPELHELGGLQVEQGQRDPAPAAAAHHAEDQHVHQQQDDETVDEVRAIGERSVVETETDEERDGAEGDGGQLREIQARAAAGTVDHHHADRAQQVHGAKQQPVHVNVQAAFEHLTSPWSSPAVPAGGAAARGRRHRRRREHGDTA